MITKEEACFAEKFFGWNVQPSKEFNESIGNWLNEINETAKFIIENKYGLNGNKKITMKEICEKFNKIHTETYFSLTPSRATKKLSDARATFYHSARTYKIGAIARQILEIIEGEHNGK